MRGAEIDVIIKDGTMLAGIVQKGIDLWTDDGIQGEITAKDNDVVRMNLRIHILYTVIGMVLVEHILRIVLVVQESQRNGRLGFRIDIKISGVHTVLLQETDNMTADPVVASLTDHTGLNSRTPQRHNGIERTAARHCTHRLLMTEYNV